MAQLGYRYPKRNFVRRAIVRLTASRLGAWSISRVLPILDRRLLALSNDRFSLSEIAAGTPVIVLTTRGARSDQLRTCHLLGIPVDDKVAVIGTNFAQTRTPAWVYNLLREPRATVAYRGSMVEVTARPVDGSEYDQVFAAAALIYHGYAVYRARLTKRQPRVFILEPVPKPTTGP